MPSTGSQKFTAGVVFALLVFVLVDALVYLTNPHGTISTSIQRYTGGSHSTLRGGLLGFLLGALLVHFTEWGCPETR
jgi:hypothetical protein